MKRLFLDFTKIWSFYLVVSPKSLIVASEKHLSTLILITMGTKRKETKKGEIVINEKYIRFDWAVKRMLRDKANFVWTSPRI